MQSAILIAVVALSGAVLGQRPLGERPLGERPLDRTSVRDTTIRECVGKVADVFFVLDSSSSIYIEDYKEVLGFVSQVVNRFDVSRDDTRIGALTFSDNFQVGFDLDRYRTKAEVLAAVNERNLPYRTGVTNTNTAINHVRQDTDFRSDITKVMVVITDGGSRSQVATQREADLAREAGFHMVVVGVGQYLDEQEWRAIASDPNNDYLFNITNFNFLQSITDRLPRLICLMPPIILGGECQLRRNADILFVAAPNGTNNALDVISDISDSFTSPQDLHVRYIMEACENVDDIDFEGADRYCDRFGDALEQTDQTYVTLLRQLRDAATEMRQDDLREDRGANQVAVIFMDNMSMRNNRFGILQEVRNAAQVDGIDVVVVDLGVREFNNFVNGMTSNRDDIIDYPGQSISESVQQILERICVNANDAPGESPF